MISIAEKIKRLRIFGIKELILLSIAGSLFIGAGCYALFQNSISPSWLRVEGSVINVTSNDDGKTYAPVISYIVDNKSYTITSELSSSNAPEFNEGKTIAYNPAKPEDAKIYDSSATLFLMILPIIGMATIIFSIISFINGSRQKKIVREIIESGQKHPGKITSMCTTTLNERTSIFNRKRRPISTITVSTRDSNDIITTYSSRGFIDEIGLSGIDFLETPVYVNMYVSSTDPQQYYVETNEIISDYTPIITPGSNRQVQSIQPVNQVSQNVSTENYDAQNLDNNQA